MDEFEKDDLICPECCTYCDKELVYCHYSKDVQSPSDCWHCAECEPCSICDKC